MKLIVTDRAHQWFKDELGLTAGTGIKFYGKTYGYTEVQKDGVNYHVDELDEWFFKDLVTTVDYNPKTDGPIFHFRHEDADDGPDVAGISKEQEEHPDASTGASQH